MSTSYLFLTEPLIQDYLQNVVDSKPEIEEGNF